VAIHVTDKILGLSMSTQYGLFRAGAYRTRDEASQSEADHLVVYRRLDVRPTTVRINSACVTGDILGDASCDCAWQLGFSLERIAAQDEGLLLYHLHHEGRGQGLVSKLRALAARQAAASEPAAERERSPKDYRRFGSSLAILQDLGIGEIVLLSNNPAKRAALEAGGIAVVQTVRVVAPDPALRDYYARKRVEFGHEI
jgi:GTP cyclohydrolase II